MRKAYLIIHILLLVTMPALLAYPPVQTVGHKKLHKNFHKEKRYGRLTYDQIIALLGEIESGRAEKKYNKKELKQINYFLAHLAHKGELSNKEHPLALQKDIHDLLSDDYAFAYALGDEEYTIIPAIYDEFIDIEFYQSGFFSHPWKKTKKFVKNHKKEIIIGAIIVVVATAVIVTIAVAPPAGAAVAAAASAASSQFAELPETPQLEAALDQQTASLKQQLDAESFFQPIDVPSLSVEEAGRALLPLFAQESYNHLQNTISTQPQLAQEIRTFNPTFIPENPSFTNFQADSYHARGEKALDSGYLDQATHDFSQSIKLDPTNATSYLDRSITYFQKEDYNRSLADFREYQSQTPTPSFSTAEFGLGFAKGLPQGIYESGEGILILLTDIMTNPIHTGQQMFESLSLLSQLARTQEWGLVAEAFAPEIRQLVTQWDTLSSETKGELAGYALGKYGADFLIPGAVGKAIAKGLKGSQELGVVYRGLKNAEKTLLLESISGLENTAKAAEVIAASERTAYLAEELGITGREMGHLKQAGKLEATLTDTYEHLSPSMQKSAEIHQEARTALKPHTGRYLAETKARAYLHQVGMPTFPRPKGIPESYLVKLSKKGSGMKYVHPSNEGIHVRVMPGKPHSPLPYQQKPYIIQMKDGKAFDKYGNKVNKKAPEAHIPLEEFTYRNK